MQIRTRKLIMTLLACAVFAATMSGIVYALTSTDFFFFGDYQVAQSGSPVTVSFYGDTKATTWDWDFGDGSANSTDQYPDHDFKAAYNYTVMQTANDGAGAATAQHEVNVLLRVNGSMDNPHDYTVTELSDNCGHISGNFSGAKKNGAIWYSGYGTGYSLNDLLNRSYVQQGATNVTFVACDNFAKNISLSTIRADPDATIFVDHNNYNATSSKYYGSLRVIVPTLNNSNYYVNNLTLVKVC